MTSPFVALDNLKVLDEERFDARFRKELLYSWVGARPAERLDLVLDRILLGLAKGSHAKRPIGHRPGMFDNRLSHSLSFDPIELPLASKVNAPCGMPERQAQIVSFEQRAGKNSQMVVVELCV